MLISRGHRLPMLCAILPLLVAATAAAESGGASPPPSTEADSVQVASSASADSASHRRFFHDVGHTFVVLGSDVGYIASSPARINGKSALWLAGILGTGAVLYANDQDILSASMRNQDDPAYHAVLELGEGLIPVGITEHTIPMYFGLMTAGYALKIHPLEEISGEILESHLICGAGMRTLAILAVGRKRPSQYLGPRAFEPDHGRSFFSGHTSAAFELATILSHHVHYTPFTVAAYAVATALPLQRINSQAHWPTDCFFGGVIGTVVAKTVLRRHEAREAGGHSMSWMPVIIPVDGAPALGVSFNF